MPAPKSLISEASIAWCELKCAVPVYPCLAPIDYARHLRTARSVSQTAHPPWTHVREWVTAEGTGFTGHARQRVMTMADQRGCSRVRSDPASRPAFALCIETLCRIPLHPCPRPVRPIMRIAHARGRRRSSRESAQGPSSSCLAYQCSSSTGGQRGSESPGHRSTVRRT
jgi:hypothetical protein